MILGSLAALLVAGWVEAARIKDIANIGGVRANQLIGYGLVVGLNGSGDRGRGGSGKDFTAQTLASMLERLGVTVDPRDVRVKNVAAVMVTAHLPPFARPGSQIDVTVSSLGDAQTLQGGTLLLTPLHGVDATCMPWPRGPCRWADFRPKAGAPARKKIIQPSALFPGERWWSGGLRWS